ncbi:MAG: AI-2E family transporter [Candidatus Peribacteraceae bacterium]|jgi:predicted PurR-regulated permease PerM
MATKKSSAFTSLRIVGKKAQNILERARRTRVTTQQKKVGLPKPEARDEVVMHLSIISVAKAGLTLLCIAVGVLAIYHLRDKLILLSLGLFVAAVMDPGIQALEQRGVPRGIAILLHYLVALFALFFLLFSFIPIIAIQLQQIAAFISSEADAFLANPRIAVPLISPEVNLRLTILTQSTLQNLSINEFSDALAQMGQTLSSAAQGSVYFAAQLAGSVALFITNLIIVLVFGFFIQLEKEHMQQWFLSFMPERYRMYASSKTEAVHSKIAQWARGELLLMFSIFLLTLIALIILRMPYALTLAALAGFCEFIPAIGPLIAAVPAVIIALSQQGFIWALVVAGVYYVIQWCENNLLVPLIMRRAVGLSPVAILFAMMVGISFPDTIHPVIGIMLAIPATTILTIFLQDWQKMHQ